MSKTDKQKSIPAATLKSLDDIPAAFEMSVKLPMKSGPDIDVKVNCKALGKLEWAEVRDRANEEARNRSEERIKAASEEDGERIKIVNVVKDAMDADAALVMEFATSWDFADELNEANLKKLENKCGGAIGAILGKYETATYQGRLGN